MNEHSQKQGNKNKIYRFIHEHRETFRQQIADELHISLSTISQNLSELEQEGLIDRSSFQKTAAGRNRKVIRIIPDTRIALGVQIENNRLLLTAVDLYGDLLAAGSVPTDYEKSDHYYESAVQQIIDFIQQENLDSGKISGISFSISARLYPEDPDAFLSRFSTGLSFPCHLEKDSAAAAAWELWTNPALENALVLLLNESLSGSVITGHQIHHGSKNHGGSVEHICLNPEGPLCYCKNRGCFDAYCSVSALESVSKMPVSDFLANLKKNKDFSLIRIWDEYLSMLALAIRNLNLIIDGPVIIGGYLSSYFTPNVQSYLLSKINAATPFPLDKKDLQVSRLGEYTAAAGAALYFINDFINTL